jgi:hypothetical protein
VYDVSDAAIYLNSYPDDDDEADWIVIYWVVVRKKWQNKMVLLICAYVKCLDCVLNYVWASEPLAPGIYVLVLCDA